VPVAGKLGTSDVGDVVKKHIISGKKDVQAAVSQLHACANILGKIKDEEKD